MLRLSLEFGQAMNILAISSTLSPLPVPKVLSIATNPSAMAAAQAGLPPTSWLEREALTTSLYPTKSTTASTGAEEATAACTSVGCFILNQAESAPGYDPPKQIHRCPAEGATPYVFTMWAWKVTRSERAWCELRS